MAEYRSKYSGAEVDALLDKIAEDNVGDIDSALSLESENPVMNKILTARINDIDTRIDSLPTKLSQFEDDVVAGKYLPLSGGTITGPLGITASAKPSSNMGFWSASDIGFIMAKSSLQFYKANTQEYFDLLHSGNVGDYAMKTDGSNQMNAPLRLATITDLTKETGLHVGLTKISGGAAFDFASFVNIYDGRVSSLQLSWFRNTPATKLVARISENGIWSAWKTIAFTDFNVASATKLQTARTIWGQSFDGTGNVSGGLKHTNGWSFIDPSNNNIIFGYDYATNSKPIYIDGAEVYMRYATSHTTGFILNSSGNVGIGTTDPKAKLHVSGDLRTYGDVFFFDSSGNTRLTFTHASDIARIYSSGNSNSLYIGEYNGKALNIVSNKVGIGTTNPAYKLDVNGDTHISGNLIVDGTITPSTSSTSYSLRGGTSNKTVVIIEVGSTEETIEHGLGADVAVSLYAKDTTKEDSWVLTSNGDIEITDTAVIVTFDNPTIVEYKVVIVG